MPRSERDQPPAILKEEALARLGGDEAFFRELLDLYASEFEKNAALLENALSRSDFTALRELGHTVKGASANLSLPPLRAAALDMEHAGRDGDPGQARAALVRLRKEFARFQAARGRLFS
jgi:HPt (histidine-containing phosphotransfer) domain-containing protein